MNRVTNKYFYLIGMIPIIWLSLLLAPILDKGLMYFIVNFFDRMQNPFFIVWCNNSLKYIILFLLIYILVILICTSFPKNYRKRQEYGSAQWGNLKKIKAKYTQLPFINNKILTQNFSVGYEGQKHKRNLNTLVIGGSGSGKTRFFAKPNVMQANTSFVILDPKGEIIRDEGYLLINKGYDVKVLDLINMNNSHCYNPFVYLQNDIDVQKLVTNLFKSTTPKGAQSQDPFWDTAASMLLLALIFYLRYEAPEEEQNFMMVLEMLRSGEVREDDDSYISPLDILFSQLEMENPNHIAVKYYKNYRSGSAKTLKSIQITLASRLDKFNLESLASLTQVDELDLHKIGERKTALFAIIPDNDTSFNFLVSILYTQLFQQLFYIADYKYNGRLPIHVHFLMDEFANVSLPDDFEKLLSVMRSREVSVSIIIQNLAQLKSLFEKQWESIVGNCDHLLYLGGNEQSTHKYISELIGKETIDLNSYGKSTGHSGNYSTNYQIGGRDLLTPDEVRMLDNKYAILFIRGERPIIDLKYNLLKHPNIKLSVDGKAMAYSNVNNNEVATLCLSHINSIKDKENIIYNEEHNDLSYEIISSEEIDLYFKKVGKYEEK